MSSGGKDVDRKQHRFVRLALCGLAAAAFPLLLHAVWNPSTRIEVAPYFFADGSIRGYRIDMQAGAASLAVRCTVKDVALDDDAESELFLTYPDAYVGDQPRFEGMTVQFDNEAPIVVLDRVELPFGAARSMISAPHLWGQLSHRQSNLVDMWAAAREQRIAVASILEKVAEAERVTITLTSLDRIFVFRPEGLRAILEQYRPCSLPSREPPRTGGTSL